MGVQNCEFKSLQSGIYKTSITMILKLKKKNIVQEKKEH